MPSSGVQTCALDRKSTRLNSSHGSISYAVFCLNNNSSSYDSPLGFGWDFLHYLRLYECSDGWVIVRHGCGTRDRYVHSGGGYVTFFFNDPATPENYPVPLLHPLQL